MKQLEEAIKNRPKHLSPDYHADCRRIFQKVEESFRKIEVEFDAFKKQLQDKGKTIEQILKEYGIDLKLPPFKDSAIWIDKREILGEKHK